MKQKSLFLSVLFVLISVVAFSQQDTITGWDFSDNTDSTFTANFGLSGNQTYDIRAEDTTGAARTLTYTNGATNYAATATGWDGGADNKFWSIKFKADGFTNMKVYSKQSAGGTNAGPKYWKVQARKSGEDWMDITGGTVTVENDWTTGVVDGIDIPAYFDLPGTTSLFIRWIMTSNESVSGADVAANGVAKIDDIFVTGVNSAGIETILFENNVSMFPNPCNETLYIESIEEMSQICIYDITGRLIIRDNVNIMNAQFDMSHLEAGLYIVTIQFKNEPGITKRKIIVE
jgi:hypothetical protein